MSALTPATAGNPDGIFVRILRDPDTGNTIIALNAAATDALDSFADAFSAGDFLDNYGAHDDPAYVAQADVVSQIRSALNKHIRGY